MNLIEADAETLCALEEEATTLGLKIDALKNSVGIAALEAGGDVAHLERHFSVSDQLEAFSTEHRAFRARLERYIAGQRFRARAAAEKTGEA